MTVTRYSIPSRKVPSHLDSVASTPSEDTLQARNGALHASCAKLSVRHRLSQSKLRSEKMDQGERQDMIST